jgi:predicted Zn-ribbon and HTH transcriptional regulator
MGPGRPARSGMRRCRRCGFEYDARLGREGCPRCETVDERLEAAEEEDDPRICEG